MILKEELRTEEKVFEMMISDAKRGENYGNKIRRTYIWDSYLYENGIRQQENRRKRCVLTYMQVKLVEMKCKIDRMEYAVKEVLNLKTPKW